jgi:hypothetical protein
VLRACHKVLRPAGRLALYTIALAPGLTPEQRRRGRAPGANVGARVPYAEMLRRAGFDGIRERDVTPAFLRTTRAWHQERELRADALIEVEGDQPFRDRQANNRHQQRAIEEGLLRRLLLTGVR